MSQQPDTSAAFASVAEARKPMKDYGQGKLDQLSAPELSSLDYKQDIEDNSGKIKRKEFEEKSLEHLRQLAKEWEMEAVSELQDERQIRFHLRKFKNRCLEQRISQRKGLPLSPRYEPVISASNKIIQRRRRTATKVGRLTAIFDGRADSVMKGYSGATTDEQAAKSMRIEASQAEPAWMQVSQLERLQVWCFDKRTAINDGVASENGVFQSTKAYIVLNSELDVEIGDYVYAIHYFVGPSACKECHALTAYKATELRYFLGGDAVSMTRIDLSEITPPCPFSYTGSNPEFCRLWSKGPQMVHMVDDVSDAWLRDIGTQEREPVLFLVRDTKRSFSLIEVKVTPKKLAKEACFILDTDQVLYTRTGDNTPSFDRAKVGIAARLLAEERNWRCEIVHVDDDRIFGELLTTFLSSDKLDYESDESPSPLRKPPQPPTIWTLCRAPNPHGARNPTRKCQDNLWMKCVEPLNSCPMNRTTLKKFYPKPAPPPPRSAPEDLCVFMTGTLQPIRQLTRLLQNNCAEKT